MSVEAMVWALRLAPVPTEEKGRGRPSKDPAKKRKPQPSSACAFVLVGLANHAGPDGKDAFPSVETLMQYTRLGERTVRLCLDRLAAAGVITPSDPAVLAAKVKRADHRPQGWDLAMDRIRDDLTRNQLTKIGKDSPFLAPFIAAHLAALDAADPSPDGVQSFHERGAVVSERGAVTAPEPSIEPSPEPSSSGSEQAPTSLGHASSGRPANKPRRTGPKPAPKRDHDRALFIEVMGRAQVEDPADVYDAWTEHFVWPGAFVSQREDWRELDGYIGRHGVHGRDDL